MKLKRLSFCCSLLLLFYSKLLFAQENKIVSVGQFTGTPNVVIPLYTVRSGGVSMPINLVYTGTGVKVQDVEGLAGMNWNVTVGGTIYREVRGLPDDCKQNQAGAARLGWLYNTNGTKINNFAIANNSSDLTYINNNFSDLSDTEPDIFHVAAPGLNCSLVFDNNHILQTIPYQDLKVSYTTDTNGMITSFTIRNDKGLTYTFDGYETTTSTSFPASPAFFNQRHQQYAGAVSVAGIVYNSSWKISSITDDAGNQLFVDMNTLGEGMPNHSDYLNFSTDSISLYAGTSSGGVSPATQYAVTSSYWPMSPAAISIVNARSINTVIHVYSSLKTHTNIPLIDSIVGYGQKIQFSYLSATGRLFLQSVSFVNDCGQTSKYQFSYTGYDINPSTGTYTIPLPDSASTQIDYWGYYNKSSATTLVPQVYVNPSNPSYERYRLFNPGSASSSYPYLLSGADRSANSSVVAAGCLNTITYPNGGTTTLTFESNDFFDNTSQAVIQGGGVRIKQITDYDGINSANNIVRNYSYVDPSTGLSSGKPIALPVFAFTTPYTGTATGATQWNLSTVRSTTNLSHEDNTIIYGYVKESMTNAGSTVYQFKTPATSWDSSASPDWSPTITQMQCSGCSSMGLVSPDKNTYPFPMNPNFDFERGLIVKATNYTDAGQEVSESNYTYNRSGSPLLATGFNFDVNGTVTSYAKYNVLTTTEELLSQLSKKVYDSQTLSQPQQTSVTYTYGSAFHKLPTQEQSTGSDGTVQNKYIKYSKDYSVSVGSDSTTNALYHLQQLNVNVPIETYNQLTKNGATTTVAGSLTKYQTVNPTGSAYLYLPVQRLKLSAANGISNFQPSTISGGFVNDSRYTAVENDQAYDFAGALLTGDDNYKHVKTIITDHVSGLAVATVSNAAYNEIAYNDFNTDAPGIGFTKSTYNYTTASRSGLNALSLEAGGVLSKTLTKNALANNYIFSAWINSSVSGSITLTLTNSSGQSASYTLPYGNTAASWNYYEVKVPVTNMVGNFTVQFQSNAAITIDDVLFYPETSEVTYNGYDPLTMLKTSETGTNGTANYYTYDSFGRLRFVYDQNKQIVAKKAYISNSGYQSFNLIDYSGPSTATTGVSNSFSVLTGLSSSCDVEGLSATWNFGDGTTGTGLTPSHTYTSAGTFNYSVAITSPYYGQRVISGNTVVVSPPPAQSIPLYYYENAGSSKITSLQFYQATTLVYSFSESDLLAGKTILQGNYSIKVNFSKLGTTFKSISYTDGNTLSGCFPSTTTSPATISLDLTNSNSISFTVDTATCLN